MTRSVLLVTHPRRPDVIDVVRRVADQLASAGIESVISEADAAAFPGADLADVQVVSDEDPSHGRELAIVLGGDGTILRGAEMTRESGVPLMGINLGKVGFLAEAEMGELDAVIEHIVAKDYAIDERMTLEVAVSDGGQVRTTTWALNEVSIEKAARERMLEVTVEIDGRPLSTWGCDGVIIATPTGSTAYAFSAGGPVVWPDVEAILLVPNSAHALFARPVVVGPTSRLAVEVIPHAEGLGVMWCDGRRPVDLRPGSRIDVRRSAVPMRLARLTPEPFTDRLVEKFDLSVVGWRGNGAARNRTP